MANTENVQALDASGVQIRDDRASGVEIRDASRDAPLAASPRWSLARKIGFRFAFTYLVLYSFPYPFSTLPGADWFVRPYDDLWSSIVPWVGHHVFRIQREIPTASTGSGDKTADFVQIGCFLILAAAATLAWSVVGRRRPHHAAVARALRVYLR